MKLDRHRHYNILIVLTTFAGKKCLHKEKVCLQILCKRKGNCVTRHPDQIIFYTPNFEWSKIGLEHSKHSFPQ